MNTVETAKDIAFWGLDNSHSEIGFRVKHLMITTVKGYFKEFSAEVTTTEDGNILTGIDFRMNAASIFTGEEQRDAHLRSADFFDAENHKEITFKATPCINIAENNEFELIGDLTIRGVTKTVRLDAEFTGLAKDPWGNMKAGYTVEGKINRKDFGLNWNVALEAGGWLVAEEVKILCEVELARKG